MKNDKINYDYKKQYILSKKCIKDCFYCKKINKYNFNSCFITKIC